VAVLAAVFFFEAAGFAGFFGAFFAFVAMTVSYMAAAVGRGLRTRAIPVDKKPAMAPPKIAIDINQRIRLRHEHFGACEFVHMRSIVGPCGAECVVRLAPIPNGARLFSHNAVQHFVL
jgi:hypothetical protein